VVCDVEVSMYIYAWVCMPFQLKEAKANIEKVVPADQGVFRQPDVWLGLTGMLILRTSKQCRECIDFVEGEEQ
jgi:hypothetical protein